MYNGNPTLRGAGEKVNMTPKRINEWIKCKEDILYFAEKYFFIVVDEQGRRPIPLRTYQKKILKAFHSPTKDRRHVVLLSARQSGKTTVASIFLLHYVLFNEDKTVAVLANKESTSMEILARIKMAFQELPLWLQHGISEDNGGWNNKKVGFENGSRLIAASTASSAIRGFTISLLYLDEFAFVPDNIADQFMSSVYPTVSSSKTSKIFIVSTPNGLNHFYQIWRNAVRGENNFMPVKVNWEDIPHYTKKWKEETIRDIGPQRFAQEYGGKFLGSANTLIESEMLERMTIEQPVELALGSFLSVYEKPVPGAMYILGIDSSKGTGKDFSVIQVLKILDEHNIEQAAVYRNNIISPHDFAQVCISVSEYFNGAYMMVENNDVGGTVGETIHYQYEYDKILNCDKKGIGIRSTRKSKLAANILLKRYVESGWLEIIDRHTLYELSRYEELPNSNNVFKAPRGENDDCVTSLLWGLFFLTTVFFDGKNLNVRVIDDRFKMDSNSDEEGPIMIIDDGGLDKPEGWGYTESYNDLDDGSKLTF